MREDFWKEVNDARKLGESRFWKGAFPEASVLDMNCLMDVNQYLATTTGNNAFKNNAPLVTPVHGDHRVKPFYTEFISNLNRIDTEIDWNSLFFFSLSDIHAAFPLHGDTETVFLIQGYGEVAMVTSSFDNPMKSKIHHMKTGDALLLPPLNNHKPIPLGPRVTLSLGALPKHHAGEDTMRLNQYQ